MESDPNWINSIFGPKGGLSQILPRYEVRSSQEKMASAVAHCLEFGGRLAVEAGTGVGKTFAYLIPALEICKDLSGPIIISTHTLNLQSQIETSDLPTVLPLFEDPPSVHVVRGGANYLCRKKLIDLAASPELPGMSGPINLGPLQDWAEEDGGLLSDFRGRLDSRTREAVRYDEAVCWRGCPEYKSCRFISDREKMRTAKILVVNHSMLLTDAKIRETGRKLLPDGAALIIDEAHRLAERAEDHLATTLDIRDARRLLRSLSSASKDPEMGGLLQSLTGLSERVAQSFEEVALSLGEGLRMARTSAVEMERIPRGNLPLEELTRALAKLQVGLEDSSEGAPTKESSDRLRALSSFCKRLSEAATLFRRPPPPDWVFWASADRGSGSEGSGRLVATPLDPASLLSEGLFEKSKAVILTSATLGVAGSMKYFLGRIGLVGAKALFLGTPFKYAEQMEVVVHPHFPLPNSSSYAEETARCLAAALNRWPGGVLALFTSKVMMEEVEDLLSDMTDDEIFCQDGQTSREELLRRFRKRGGILLGLKSFWEGVDLPGRQAETLVIVRLPFPVPDGPVERARSASLKERGLNPFTAYSLPEAALSLRQGVGRLIRSRKDKGRVLILDPRIVTRSYGKVLLESLPKCPIREAETD